MTCTKGSFFEFEQRLLPQAYELGRLFITLFLWMRQEHWQANHAVVEKGSKCQGLKDRLFGTVFGKVRYWRTYIYRGKPEFELEYFFLQVENKNGTHTLGFIPLRLLIETKNMRVLCRN